MIVRYIDVSSETDLTAVNAGALLASLGMSLGKVINARFGSQKELAGTFDAIRRAAYGHEKSEWVGHYPDEGDYGEPDEDDDYEPGHYQTTKIPGKLRPPFPALQRDITELATHVSRLTGLIKEQHGEVVVIFDGLDRLIKADQFWSVAEQDLRAIKLLGISVLTAGPLSVMYGQGRQIKDYFDEVHYLPPAVADPKKSPFLLEILYRRGADELMHPDDMQKLCLASGGVLRDLISLARSAGENAYLEDSDTVAARHVDAAIEQLGGSYLLGLGTRQKKTLRRLLDGGGFAPSDSESMELLISRRVLEQSESRYEVHPSLATVLSAGNADTSE